ncbi:MAG: type II secretion system ATPase GspE [Rhabdochlamydiaceae bacterium]
MSKLELLALAEKYGLPFEENLSSFSLIKNRITKVPYLFCKNNKIIPFEEKEGKLLVAVTSPYCLDVIEQIAFMTNLEVEPVLSFPSSIEEGIEDCYQHKSEDTSTFIKESKEDFDIATDDEEEDYDLLESSSDSNVIKILNMIILEAIKQKASDIHFEPLEDGLGIRYRIDGVLQNRHRPHKDYQNRLITRIKVMSKLDIAEHRLPQDGRIKLKIGNRQIDFRVSSVPTTFGERIVLRILDKSNILMGLEHLGMRDEIEKAFQTTIKLNEGIVLVTGPTGSGKTTTLYSALSAINSDGVNIMTVEDPVEYKLQGMAQIGVNPKINLTFSKGLRHILRQDPDVIMIGEIRDKETAEIAIQASLTGHLVLTTLHTNDAPSALTRLVDMGIEPYLLSSTVLGVLAQRLVRNICPDCKASYEPSSEELKELGLKREQLKEGLLFQGRGCESCFGSGYRGRSGIYEWMKVTDKIKKQIIKSADAYEMQLVAYSEGMLSLRQEGALLVAKGVTTISEILRVSKGS